MVTKMDTLKRFISPRSIQKLGQLILIIAFVGLLGCSKRYHDMPAYVPFNMGDVENFGVGRFKTSYLADQIDYYYRGTTTGPIGITTVVDLNDLYSTSSFGRMFAEQLMSELVMRGYDVIEMRHSDALYFLANTGEFSLSRDVTSVNRVQDLAAVLAGTYVASPNRVYVNVRLIDPATSMILSGGSVELTKTREIAKLLRGSSFPGTLERIPVKHLATNTYPLMLVPAHQVNQWDAEESNTWTVPQPEYKSAPKKKEEAKKSMMSPEIFE